MRTSVILCGLLIVLHFECGAQSIFVKGGYATYDMSDLKDFQESLRTSTPIPFQLTDAFPAYYTFSVEYRHRIKERLLVGAHLEYKSTAARLHYADYSGEAYIHTTTNGILLSLSVVKYLMLKPQSGLYLYLNPGVNLSTIKLSTGAQVGNSQSVNTVNLSSTSFGFEPGIGYERYFSRFIASLDVGYEVAFKSKIYGDGNAYLINSQNQPIYLQWSGARVRLGIGYRLGN